MRRKETEREKKIEKEREKKKKKEKGAQLIIYLNMCTHACFILLFHGPQRRSLRTSSVVSPPVVVIHGFASIGIDACCCF